MYIYTIPRYTISYKFPGSIFTITFCHLHNPHSSFAIIVNHIKFAKPLTY